MWVITVFNNINDIEMYEYTEKAAAVEKLSGLHNAILSYTK
ncbi:hypothetical protein [Kurthia massiliensis]|nr:hypothetical protein [Kurthia massiliensis]